MRTLRGPSRSLKSLHRIVSTSDVPFVTRRHSRVGIRCPPDLLSVITLLADGDAEFDLRARGLLLRRAGEGKTGISPRTPSIVSRTCKRLTRRPCTWRILRKPCTRAPFRRLPIRAPRQAVLRTSSWLAPSGHQQVLRPPSEEDARCVQPTSATQSNCVHPHLVCSWLAVATFVARRPRGD
jgi:hypothetical protein